MVTHPSKIRLMRRRGDVIVDLLVPKSGSGWYVRESVNMGAVSLSDAVVKLAQVDPIKVPLLAALVVATNPEG